MNAATSSADVDPRLRPGRGVAIEATALTRRFGERLALDRLTLRIAPGESFALLGANGAGKTTFIRLVTGALLPSSGELTVDGLSPALRPAEVHARLGFVMETSRLYPEQRVQGFLRFMGGCARARGRRARARGRRRARALRARVGGNAADRESLEGLPAARLARAGVPQRSAAA